MTWWCSTTKMPWNWDFQAYPGIWLAMLTLIGSYTFLAVRHVREHGMGEGDRRKFMWFGFGAALLWLSTDWPLGALGASYLAVAHMVQYMLYTLIAAPMLMLGTPEWMARGVIERFRLMRLTRFASKPLIAGVAFNIILVATHAPFTVDTLRVSQFGSMALDVLWILSGFVLWLPVISPLPELQNRSAAVKCIYLFLAAGAIPMLPGGMLTFSEFPLYGIYELAPRVGGISAANDQQAAGILMKIGNIPIVWITIFVLFVRWAMIDRDASRGFGIDEIPTDVSALVDGEASEPGDGTASGTTKAPAKPASFKSHASS